MFKDPPRACTPGLYLLTASFVAGVASSNCLPVLPSPWSALWIAPLAVAAYRCPRTLPLAVFAAGAAWAVLRAALVLDDGLADPLAGRELIADGQIVSLLDDSGRMVRFDFDIEHLGDGARRLPSPGRVRLRVYDQNLDLEPGARWRLVVRLRRARGLRNPGGFDYERYLFRHGIRATGYVRRSMVNEKTADPSPFSIAALRHRISAYLTRAAPASDSRAVVVALGVGDRSQLDNAQWDLLTSTGTNHLMAISGLHVGLVAGLAFWLGTRLWRLAGRAPLVLAAPYAGAACAIAAATAYALLAGLSTPTQRALIMLLCVMWALVSRRPASLGRGLALAFWLVLLVDPLSVLDAGFWLSFTAVVAIALILGAAPQVTAWRQWLRVQLWLGLVLGPFTVAWFGHWPLVAPLANLFAVPVVGFAVVPLTLLAVTAAGLGLEGLAGAAVTLAVWLLDQVLAVLGWLAQIPAARWRPPAVPSWWALAAALGGILCLLLPVERRARVPAALWLLPMLTTPVPKPAHGTVVATVLDVGQGLAVAVHTRNHVLVYDTGARLGADFDLGAAVVVPYLRQRAVTRIDTLIISHGDNDHIGGARSVLAAMPVARILSSVPRRLPAAHACVAGQRWHWDGVDFTILHPETAEPVAHNNASCVLRVSGRWGTLLLTGDIESQAESALLARRPQALTADVLLVPHQGSKTSSTARFIDAVAPRLAVVSTGHRNRYGHPAVEIVARYRARAIPLLDTARLGAVEISLSRSGIDWRGWRSVEPHYWSDRSP